jgi:uncharacterized protein (TIGR02421 family)
VSQIIKIEEKKFAILRKTILLRLSQNKKIRRVLPGGRIHIDRTLPFLCVYRQLASPDEGTRRLVMGEASYITATGSDSFKKQLTELIRAAVETLSLKFGAFLIIEIWAAPDDTSLGDKSVSPAKPTFRIFTQDHVYGPLEPVRSTLERALKKIKVLKVPAQVDIVYRTQVTPPDFKPLLTTLELKQSRCHLIGIEVQPVYRNQNPDKFFPGVLQGLHRGIARALKQSIFKFVQTQTTQSPANYHALGRRSMVKAVWEVDRRLSEISSQFSFLLLVTPVNIEAAWRLFRRSKFRETPVFYYRPIPIDLATIKRQLYGIPLQRIEDPTLEHLFREKQAEFDQKFTMLTNRGNSKMLYGCLQLYGDVEKSLVSLAQDLLKALPKNKKERDEEQNCLSAEVFAQRASDEIKYYRKMNPNVTGVVQIRDDVYGNMVVAGNLLLGKNTKIPVGRVDALIQHEIGTHLLTYFNGLAQPFQQLASGMAGYEELQEGLAVLAEYFVDGLDASRLRVIAARVIAVQSLIARRSFVETFHRLVEEFKISTRTAFIITMRVYRGGGLTKDIVYLRGVVDLLKYLKQGGNIELLFIGKMAMRHVPVVQELLSRKVLQPAAIRPRYMDFPETKKKLERLKKGLLVHELVNGR